ncbi:hypothetical protein [Limnohabitans sp. 2KL-51]|uniref:hypothetical protein n=1 Tax=Limnohabitans sp. 2KL-51 TaxID=1977911 RepID=UPI0011B20828|nr:hypothetical protein [Limnohabitans sp. 2KL-51]
MKNTIKLLLATASVTLLAACGGGGGGTPAPVASTSTFDLRAAYVALYTTPSSNQFTLNGTVNGVSVTGSGTATSGAVTTGTFEGLQSLQRSQTISATLSGNGQTLPLTVTSTDWTDSNYVPRGSTGDEYEVVVGTPTIPTTARVNDTGVLYTATLYPDSRKQYRTGSVVASYVVEPETATTAIVKLIRTSRDTNSTITDISTGSFRIDATNRFVRLNESLISISDASTLTVTYR